MEIKALINREITGAYLINRRITRAINKTMKNTDFT